MSAVNVSIGVDWIEKVTVTPHVYNGETLAFIDIDGISIHGKNAAKFREIAARFTEAAAILETANVAPAAEPVQAESGVA